jgi:hypothetical protein
MHFLPFSCALFSCHYSPAAVRYTGTISATGSVISGKRPQWAAATAPVIFQRPVSPGSFKVHFTLLTSAGSYNSHRRSLPLLTSWIFPRIWHFEQRFALFYLFFLFQTLFSLFLNDRIDLVIQCAPDSFLPVFASYPPP